MRKVAGVAGEDAHAGEMWVVVKKIGLDLHILPAAMTLGADLVPWKARPKIATRP